MLSQEKLAYLQKKLIVAQTLGDMDTAAMWQELIDELKEKILALPISQTPPDPIFQNQYPSEDRSDFSKEPLARSASV
jgi:hypothetical protein